MRAAMIELVAKRREAALLRAVCRSRGLGRFPFQRAVKPLVSAILRGPAWFNQLRHAARLPPADRRGGQGGGGPRGGKGAAVVAADALRQAILAKHALEHAARAG